MNAQNIHVHIFLTVTMSMKIWFFYEYKFLSENVKKLQFRSVNITKTCYICVSILHSR